MTLIHFYWLLWRMASTWAELARARFCEKEWLARTLQLTAIEKYAIYRSTCIFFVCSEAFFLSCIAIA